MAEKHERLMKFTGDLKALPYRELMVFAIKLRAVLNPAEGFSDSVVAQCLVAVAEEINPDVDPEVKGPRVGLSQRIGTQP